MAKVKVGTGRSHIEQTNHGLRITIPAKKNIFLIAFLALWLVGWVFGELSAIKGILDPKDASSRLFLMVWLAGWSVGGVFALFAWCWNVAGKEIINVTLSELSHIKSIFGFSRSKEYEMPSISKLRINPQNTSIFSSKNGMEFWGIAGGTIAFDYGKSTHVFGAQLDEAEASHIIESIKNRFTSL